MLAQIENRLGYLSEIGLDYLTLDRPARSLSGGELQRVTLTKTLGSGLVNTLYVLDEPTAGLHPHEVGPLIAILHRLRDQGNTLVVVEHDHDLIRGSDHVVDLGPGAGAAGGQVLYSGPLAGFCGGSRVRDQRLLERAQADRGAGDAATGHQAGRPVDGSPRKQPEIDRCRVPAGCSLRRDRESAARARARWSRRRSTRRCGIGSRASPRPPPHTTSSRSAARSPTPSSWTSLRWRGRPGRTQPHT